MIIIKKKQISFVDNSCLVKNNKTKDNNNDILEKLFLFRENANFKEQEQNCLNRKIGANSKPKNKIKYYNAGGKINLRLINSLDNSFSKVLNKNIIPLQKEKVQSEVYPDLIFNRFIINSKTISKTNVNVYENLKIDDIFVFEKNNHPPFKFK